MRRTLFTDEQHDYRESFRRFLAEEVRPHYLDWEREGIVPRGGVVGYQLPALREATLPIARGDVLILATDGLRHDFVLDWPARANAQDYASYLLDRYGKDSDDALALVVRYLGRSQ